MGSFFFILLVVADLVFKIWLHCFLSLPYLVIGFFCVGRRLQRRITEGRKRLRYHLNFNFYFWISYGYSVERRYLPGLSKNSRISQISCWNTHVIFGGWYIQIGVVMSSWCFWYRLVVEGWSSVPLSRHVVSLLAGERSFLSKRSQLNESFFLMPVRLFSCMREFCFLSEATGNC